MQVGYKSVLDMISEKLIIEIGIEERDVIITVSYWKSFS